MNCKTVLGKALQVVPLKLRDPSWVIDRIDLLSREKEKHSVQGIPRITLQEAYSASERPGETLKCG
jgi:hypothetical protein